MLPRVRLSAERIEVKQEKDSDESSSGEDDYRDVKDEPEVKPDVRGGPVEDKMSEARTVLHKFNGQQFGLWKFQLEVYFKTQKMLDLVKGTEAKPVLLARDDQAPLTAWIEKDTKAMSIIAQALEFDQLQHVCTAGSAAEMWTGLQAIHQHKSTSSRHLLLRQFYKTEMKSGESMGSLVARVQAMAMDLKDCGRAIADEDVVAVLINALPTEYDSFQSAWDSVEEAKKTKENLITRLMKEDYVKKMRDGEQGKETSPSDSAAFNMRTQRQGQRAVRRDRQRQFQGKCWTCGGTGHMAAKCPQKQSLDAKDKSSGFTGTRDGQRGTSKPGSAAFIVQRERSVSSRDCWYTDCGASHHICCRREWFSSYEELPADSWRIRIGNNKCVSAIGRGDILIESRVAGQWEQHVIKDALYYPDCPKNLFSVGQAADKGIQFVYSANTVILKDKKIMKKVVGVGIRDAKSESSLYRLDFRVIKDPCAHSDVNLSTGPRVQSLTVWHRRLAHVNVRSIIAMQKNDCVTGLNIASGKEIGFCDGCAKGKIHRQPFSSEGKKRCAEPGQVIHVDLNGKMSIPSLGGALYFLLAKDDCSNYTIVYFIRDKTEVLQMMKRLLMEVADFGHQVRVIRSDMGTEFLNAETTKFLFENGIRVKTSPARCPEQNGFIERQMRTVEEAARAMLHADASQGLSTRFWGEAVNNAVYVLNRIGSPALEGKSPYELFVGKKPSVAHVRVFGCTAHMHVEKQHRTKWTQKSREMIHVGYDDEKKAYRLVDKERWWTGKVFFSRNVVVKENVMEEVVIEEKDEELDSGREEEEKEDDIPAREEDQQSAKQKNPRQPIPRDSYPLRNKRGKSSRADADAEHGSEDDRAEEAVLKTSQVRKDEVNEHDVRGGDCQTFIHEAEFFAMISEAETIDDPKTLKEALSSREAEGWKAGLASELASHKKNGSWILVPRPKGKNVVSCKWVFKRKMKDAGDVQHKARLCARGFQSGRRDRL